MREMATIRSVREQITDHVREDILCGRFEEGQRLSEVSLAKRFGVSRGPIRDALLQLTQEGLLHSRPNRGVIVAPTADDAVCELIMAIRRKIEVFALRSLYDDLTERDYKAWGDILLRMEHACRQNDLPGILNSDMAFHRSILVRAAQPDLLGIWQSLIGRVRTHFWTAVKQYDEVTDIHTEHVALVERFRAGPKETAAQALTEHIW